MSAAGTTVAAGPWPTDLVPRSPFWAAAAPLLVTTDAAALGAHQVGGVAALLELAPGDRVLDLACATNGHVALALAHRDLEVVAVTRRPALGHLLASRARDEGVGLQVVIATGPDWATQVDPVNVVLDLGSPFGVVDAPEEPGDLLDDGIGRLGPGGRAVVATLGTEVALGHWVGRDWYEHGDRLVLLEAEPDEAWTTMSHRWRLHEGDGHADLSFDHALLSGRQLANRLGAAGLGDCTLHGGDVAGAPTGRPYDRTAHRLLAVARR